MFLVIATICFALTCVLVQVRIDQAGGYQHVIMDLDPIAEPPSKTFPNLVYDVR